MMAEPGITEVLVCLSSFKFAPVFMFSTELLSTEELIS